MMQRHYPLLPYCVLLSAVILFRSCGTTDEETAEVVLAKIGDREITVNDFLYRAELTIRPNNFKDKEITLNNLITEKILAIEAGPDNELLNKKSFKLRIKGIQEQSMRDALYNEIAVKNVVLDSAEVNRVYRNSLREYDLEFYIINDRELAEKIKISLDSMPETADQIFKELQEKIGEKPHRSVKYKDPDDDAIHDALYSELLEVGTIIGPTRLSSGAHILMKITDWSDNLVFGGEDQQIRWNEVYKKMRQAKSRKLWNTYQTELMQDKVIEFDPESYKILALSALEYYQKKAVFDTTTQQLDEIPFKEPDIDLNAPFLKVGNLRWTVADFREALYRHPLVFRTKYLTKDNFTRHFGLAIKDMLRDEFLTREAYKRSLDKSKSIQHTVEMWQDAILADNQKKVIMQTALDSSLVDQNDPLEIRDYWDNQLRKLQHEYSQSIRVNYDEFNKIRLTKIDLLAIRPGVPYSISVPNFPLLMASGDLSYTRQDSSGF